MPRTLIKSRIHHNQHKPKINKKKKILNHNFLHIYKHLNKNHYPERMFLLNINNHSYNCMCIEV